MSLEYKDFIERQIDQEVKVRVFEQNLSIQKEVYTKINEKINVLLMLYTANIVGSLFLKLIGWL